MKRLALAFVCAASLMASARTVVAPHVRSTGGFQFGLLRSVELTDTAAVLNLSFIHLPGYWCSMDSPKLVGDSTGTVYDVRFARGYEFGMKQPMPESGRFDFSVAFDPVKVADGSVSLVDGESVLISGISLSGNAPDAKIHTRINGTASGPSGFVGLHLDQARMPDEVVWIPVDSGRFVYDLYVNEHEVYNISDGIELKKYAFRNGRFMAEDGEIDVAFSYDDDGSVSNIDVDAPAGSLSAQLFELSRKINDMYHSSPECIRYDSLMKSETFYVPEYYAAVKRIGEHPEERDSLGAMINALFKRGEAVTPEGNAAEQALKRFVENDMLNMQLNEAEKLSPVAGLYTLASLAWYREETSRIVESYLRAFAGKLPGHPYDAYLAALASTTEPVPGNPIIDFSAPDLDGNIHTLSEKIKGRPALIDLWASWCGPCRRTSKSMIPVYEEFAPKGFVIVGVARELRDSAAMVKAIEQDGYPWLNLIELADANAIWAKYRIQNAAGSTYLVGPDGIIVAVNPTADQVRAYLSSLYD